MNYIIASLHFTLEDKKHVFFAKREKSPNLPLGTFNEICQYLTELTNTPAPSVDSDLTTDQVINALETYPLSIGYFLCTDFQNDLTGWTSEPYTKEEASKEMEEENGN